MDTTALQILGWTWAEACARVARGESICQVEVPDILARAQEDIPELLEERDNGQE